MSMAITMRHRCCPLHLPLIAAALVMLLMASVQAMPEGTAVWTEEPRTDTAQRAQGAAETKLSDPITFNLSGNEPRTVLLGEVQYNYSDCSCGSCSPGLGYASSQIWIQKNETWMQHDQITAGDAVELIAHTPEDGNADLYLISYANSSIAHWSFKSLCGYYHRLRLVPEETGRLFLILTQGNSPGSALILDVLPRPPDPASSALLDIEDVRIGEALITVRSDRIRGFDIHVNGVFFSSDQSDGSLDGNASFTVGTGKTQTITVFQRDGRGNIINKSEHTRSFQRDKAYTLCIS